MSPESLEPWNFEVNKNPQEPARTRGCRHKKTAPRGGFNSVLAEREGFEPSVPFSTPDFESGTIDHSATSPQRAKL